MLQPLNWLCSWWMAFAWGITTNMHVAQLLSGLCAPYVWTSISKVDLTEVNWGGGDATAAESSGMVT